MEPTNISLIERYQGCLLGLAVDDDDDDDDDDAVGAPIEFKTRGRFTPIIDMVSGGEFKMAKGEWTDDTAMALCLAQSLLACDGFNAKDEMEKYVEWINMGYFSTRDRGFGIG